MHTVYQYGLRYLYIQYRISSIRSPGGSIISEGPTTGYYLCVCVCVCVGGGGVLIEETVLFFQI